MSFRFQVSGETCFLSAEVGQFQLSVYGFFLQPATYPLECVHLSSATAQLLYFPDIDFPAKIGVIWRDEGGWRIRNSKNEPRNKSETTISKRKQRVRFRDFVLRICLGFRISSLGFTHGASS
ncbi:MAG TPA: hypothetical protein DCP63_05660 [Bacteroidetes bacterium]|nr:hypothetical protein [Bacteroidota bacterium]